MTLLTDPIEDAPAAAPTRPLWMPVAIGALGAVASLLLVVAVVLGAWSADDLSPGTAGQATGAASAVWLAMGVARVELDGVHLGFLPLLLVAVPLVPAILALRWLMRRRVDEDGWIAGLLPRGVLRMLGLWWGGHALVVLAATGLARLGPITPVPWTLIGPLVLLPLLAIAVVLSREARGDEWLLGPRLDGSDLPIAVRRAVGPALRGAGLLLLLGMALVVVMVAMSWDEVTAVRTAVGGGAVGGAVLWLVQGSALPNLGVWAVSFVAGPGFTAVDGASVTWSGARSGLLPLVPVLAALPQPQSFPWFVALGVLVPVVIGGVVARWSLRAVARLSSLGTKVTAAASASVLTAMVVAALDLLGGGSLGGYRLADIGAPAGWLLLALVGELLVGALAVACWDAWRLRR